MKEVSGVVALFLILNEVVSMEAYTLNSALKSEHFYNIIYISVKLIFNKGFPEEKQSTDGTRIRASVFHYCPLNTCPYSTHDSIFFFPPVNSGVPISLARVLKP